MSQFQNSTVREMASNSMAELVHEQAYLTMLYERLDVLKTTTDQRLAEVRLGAGSACAATITISCWSIGVPVRRSRSIAPPH